MSTVIDAIVRRDISRRIKQRRREGRKIPLTLYARAIAHGIDISEIERNL